jgi:hypothetical protein
MKYEYRLGDSIDTRTPVTIECPQHGTFVQKPLHHLRRRQGCPACGGTKKKTTEQFIAQACAIHKGKYDYSKTIYTRNHEQVCIICPLHGEFLQTPASHTLSKNPSGCPKCGGHVPYTRDSFIEAAAKRHQGRYNYDRVVWRGPKVPVVIDCPYHGPFSQKPHVHLIGCGCQRCASSKGETIVREVLSSVDLRFEEQVCFPDCKDRRPLPFDFVVYHRGRKFVIEYHGAQHFRSVAFSGNKSTRSHLLAEVQHESVKKHDQIKSEWCRMQQIPLCKIHYSAQSSQEIEEQIRQFLGLP